MKTLTPKKENPAKQKEKMKWKEIRTFWCHGCNQIVWCEKCRMLEPLFCHNCREEIKGGRIVKDIHFPIPFIPDKQNPGIQKENPGIQKENPNTQKQNNLVGRFTLLPPIVQWKPQRN